MVKYIEYERKGIIMHITNTSLYEKCVEIKEHILSKTEPSFLEYYIKEACSYVISITHENLYSDYNSFSKCAMYKSLIECIAMINMINKNIVIKDFEAKDYAEIVKHCYPEMYDQYHILSVIAKPNHLAISYPYVKKMNSALIEARIFFDFSFSLIMHSEYNMLLPKKKLENITRNAMEEPFNNYYYNRILLQRDLIERAAQSIKKNLRGENSDYYLFLEISNSINSLAIDKVFKDKKLINYKFKTIIELLALNYHLYTKEFYEDNTYIFDLLEKYTIVNLNPNENNDDLLNEAHELYNENISEISMMKFKEIFNPSLKFIPEKYSVEKLVHRVIDVLADNDEACERLKDLYDNTYSSNLIDVNELSDENAIIKLINDVIRNIYALYIAMLKSYILSGKNKYKSLLYDLNKLFEMYKAG